MARYAGAARLSGSRKPTTCLVTTTRSPCPLRDFAKLSHGSSIAGPSRPESSDFTGCADHGFSGHPTADRPWLAPCNKRITSVISPASQGAFCIQYNAPPHHEAGHCYRTEQSYFFSSTTSPSTGSSPFLSSDFPPSSAGFSS